MGLQVRVFVHCGNRLLSESITRILIKKTDFDVTPTTSPCLPIESQVSETEANILVCDSVQFFLREFNLADSSQSATGKIRSILIAMEDDAEDFLTAVRHGVLGYVLKEASAVEVVSAVRAVAAGEASCPSRLAKVLFDSVASQLTQTKAGMAPETARLTRREQQLIPLINRGLTNKEIANQLNVSEQTVKTHVHRILHKIGVEDRQSISKAIGTK